MNHLEQNIRLLIAVAVSVYAVTTVAAVTAEEAKQLGGPALTEFGAERAGNNEGTIPEYTGKGVKAPPNWDPKNPGQRPDPYGEKPLFSITAQNASQYADKLDGMVEVFKRYPDFRMDIYPSHRDWVFPQYVLDNTVNNATTCKAVDNELKLEGCYGGLPFPIPKTGNQAMWNHLTRYNFVTMAGIGESWIVPTSGDPVLVERGEYLNNWPFFDPAKTGPYPADGIFWRYLGKIEAPARSAGAQLMLLDPLDQLSVGRRAYVYVTGRRWTKLAADLVYDTPSPYSGGSATMDDGQVFMGALDRYDFKLIGKKEKFVSYNNFKMTDSKSCTTATVLSTRGFPNPDCARWELHRVWVVHATLKPGFNHVYHKRIFYWDEDGFSAGQSENYDANGKLFRMAYSIYYPHFEGSGGWGGTDVYMDLRSGIWTTTGATFCVGCGYRRVSTPISELTFTPGGMTAEGVR
jgi:Protein of unknown function (DUF1329)